MTLRETFRFELRYQLRQATTWIYVAALLGIAVQVTVEIYAGSARSGGFHFNSPFVVANVTLLGSIMALLGMAAFAGEAAARDVRTRMYPLVYAAPVGRAAHLGGRFLAALALAALLLLALPAGLLIASRVPEPELLGPYRLGAYAGAYLAVALPNAFVATALLFCAAALTRRAMVSYLVGVLLLTASVLCWLVLAVRLQHWEVARLLDPLGMTALSEIGRSWTSAEKGTRLVATEWTLLQGRLLWVGVALGALALTFRRFRFEHLTPGAERRPRAARAQDDAPPPLVATPVARAFGVRAHLRQAAAVAWDAYRAVMTGWGGLTVAGLVALMTFVGPGTIEHLGVPLLPTTAHLVASLLDMGDDFWAIVPLLITYYAGELVWREREAGLGAIADAAPAPEWVHLAGKLLGLALVLATLQAGLVLSSVLVQLQLGFHDPDLGLAAGTLLGLALADYLLFAVLAVAVHAVVNQKYVAHLVLLFAYGLRAFGPSLGVDQPLLLYGADPGWNYSALRGFGPYLAPVVWFKLYWAAWALLLALAARLAWVRGAESDLRARLRVARQRVTRTAAGAGAVGAGLVLALGGFVYARVPGGEGTPGARDDRRAEYERRFGRFAAAPQPRLAAASLRVELYPSRRSAEVRGTYRLVNATGAPLDTVHVATSTAAAVTTAPVTFDRPARLAAGDDALGHRAYALATPLRPGDTLTMRFTVHHRPRGFPAGANEAAVSPGATYVERGAWLPALGYQREREVLDRGERRLRGLPPRAAMRALDDSAARHDVAGEERIAFEAVVGTEAGQTALAPGRLRRAWTERGRAYFHYVTDAPIRNEYALFSAPYAVRRARWRDVDVEVLHHPSHAANVDRTVRAVRASLEHLTARLGPYAHGQIRLVERPGESVSLHGSPVNMWFQEGFALLDAAHDPRDIDFAFAVVGHEVAHQWWGNQLSPAPVEGGALLAESLAWHSALGVVRATYGDAHLARLLAMMREAYLDPRPQAGVPLLRTTDRFVAYRRGPFAMHALREYVGEARVDSALRRLLARHGAGAPPLPTARDLYAELRAATPDSLRPLLADLFEANTYWELAARRASAAPAPGGGWRVTLDVRARKLVVDTAGVGRDVPMDDVVEVGVYGPEAGGAPLYLRTHRLRAGAQTITVTVRRAPARAGVDPRALLLDVKPADNVRAVEPPAR